MAIRPTFSLKHFEQLAASMMNLMASVQTAITDYNIGSVNRTMFEAFAMELEELYYRTFQGIEDGIPAGVYEAFGFGRLPATPAVGNITFSRSLAASQNYVVPAGTVVTTSTGTRFATIVDVTLLASTTSINAQIVAEESGIDGNVGAGSIVLLASSVLGIEAVTNSTGTSGGADEETASDQQVRFAGYIVSIARSPINGLEAGAKTAQLLDAASGLITEKVSLATVVEPYVLDPTQPVGIVTLYIDNGSGGASTTLVLKTQQIIDGYVDETGIKIVGYRAAGIIVRVVAVTLFSQDVGATITLDAGADETTVSAALDDAIASVFEDIPISEGLDWPTLLTAMMVVSGVKTIQLTTPSASVAGQVGKRLRPGTITLLFI